MTVPQATEEAVGIPKGRPGMEKLRVLLSERCVIYWQDIYTAEVWLLAGVCSNTAAKASPIVESLDKSFLFTTPFCKTFELQRNQFI